MELGTALAIVAFADQCLKYGGKFVRRCQSYLHAEEEATGLLVAIESNWLKMEVQIEMLKKVADSMDKRMQDMQARVLSQLEGKLKTATLIISELITEKSKYLESQGRNRTKDQISTALGGLQNMKASKKTKYVVKKDSLNQILDEIEKWQARFDPSWCFIMLMPAGNKGTEMQELPQAPVATPGPEAPIIVAARGICNALRAAAQGSSLRKSIWLDGLEVKASPLPRSSAQLASNQNNTVILDRMTPHVACNIEKSTKLVRDLANILNKVDPSTFGLLRCRGVIRVGDSGGAQQQQQQQQQQTQAAFDFIFDIPSHLSNPQSLRHALLSGKSYPLNERFDLAKRLTNSILFVHTARFVHKNIRPETILLFRNAHSDIGSSFLVGFEQFRVEDGITYRAGDDAWERNLYRHPSRQGINPGVDYVMQHDIYSLGVVLLEIGLWTSLVDYGEGDSQRCPGKAFGPPSQVIEGGNLTSRAKRNKLRLEQIAAQELPPRVGKRYTDLVLLCLGCLDMTNVDGQEQGFGVDCLDSDGVTIGVRYIETILEKMQGINV